MSAMEWFGCPAPSPPTAHDHAELDLRAPATVTGSDPAAAAPKTAAPCRPPAAKADTSARRHARVWFAPEVQADADRGHPFYVRVAAPDLA